MIQQTYSLYDVEEDRMTIEHVSKEEVMDFLGISLTTFHSYCGNNIVIRKKYRIVHDNVGKERNGIPGYLWEQWRQLHEKHKTVEDKTDD